MIEGNIVQKNKIIWLSILQGWSMLLVVIGHISLSNEFQDPQYPISSFIEKVIYSFHMPLFMFISGMLLYHTKISKEPKYRSVIVDKIKRLGIPLLFFTFLTLLLKMAFNPLMKRPVEFSLMDFLNYFLYPGTNPLGEMWFIVTLLIIFLFYPFFVWSLRNNRRIVCTILFLLVLNISFPKDIHLLCLSSVAYMLFFFYLGMLIYLKRWISLLSSFRIFLVLLLVFAFTNVFTIVPFVSVLVGIAFSISLCFNIDKVFPSSFHSFRDYTFQIFLMGIFFQIGVRFFYIHLNMGILYLPLYLLSILLALYFPVLISKVILKSNISFLCMCFGLRYRKV